MVRGIAAIAVEVALGDRAFFVAPAVEASASAVSGRRDWIPQAAYAPADRSEFFPRMSGEARARGGASAWFVGAVALWLLRGSRSRAPRRGAGSAAMLGLGGRAASGGRTSRRSGRMALPEAPDLTSLRALQDRYDVFLSNLPPSLPGCAF